MSPSAFAVFRLITNSNLVDCSGEIGGLCTLDDFSGVHAGSAIRVGNTRSVAHQATGGDVLARVVHGRHPIAGRQLRELMALTEKKSIGTDQEYANLPLGEAREGSVDVLHGASAQDMKSQCE
jgi:hypothetical protein